MIFTSFPFPKTSWFYQKYYSKLGVDPFNYGRFLTFQTTINLFLQRRGRIIFETGCQRAINDWGAGCSTQIFSEVIDKYGGHLYSIDISQDNLNLASQVVGNTNKVSFICSDSIEGIKQQSKSFKQTRETIDLLYLDSLDYPYGPILEAYGGKEDLDRALQILRTIPDEEVLGRFQALVTPCQEHTLNELKAALPVLSTGSLILIDDANLAGGGKARLAKEYMLSHTSYELIIDAYQSLWQIVDTQDL